jgi:hypothetical protein
VLVGGGVIETAGVAVAVGAAAGGEDDWAQDESNNMQRDAVVQMTLALYLNIRYPFNSLFKIMLNFHRQHQYSIVTLSASFGSGSMGTEMLPLRCAQGFGSCAQHDIPGVKVHYEQAARKEYATWLR